MATKRDSGEWAGPRRLPSVREKLSGFVKRGRGLAKKSTLSLIGERSQRPSLDESQKALPRVEVQAFGTSSLEIDLTSLEAFRDVPMPPPQKKPEQQQPPPTTSSTTPIADMFSAKRTPLTEPSPANNYSLNKSSPSLIDALKKSTRAEDRRSSMVSSQAAQTSDPATNVTVINLTHSVPHTAKPWPPPEKPRATVPNRLQANKPSDSKQPGRIQLREPRRAAFVPSGPAAINMPPMSRPRLNADIASEIVEKRYSTPPTGLSSLGAAPTSVPAETIRSDRRRSWQPAPTSVPSGSSTPSAPPSASAPWRNGLGNRRISPRLATDRLAWIKELEEGKKKTSINGDLPVLKSVQGSVADKLARFEQKQQQQQLAPLTRSNSTRSRNSSVADTTFSSYGGAATSRSSLDSHRASSVFSHYDDTFREKMELVAGRKGDEEAEERPALQKVTTSFVSIGKKDKQASVDTAQAAEEPKGDEKVEEVENTGDEKVPDVKIEESKVEEAKVEEAKVEEAKVEEPKVEEPKVDTVQAEEPKVEEAQVEEPKVEEPEVEEPQTESVQETEDVEKVDDVKVDDFEKTVEAEKIEDVHQIESSENVEEVQNAEEVRNAEKVELAEVVDVPQVVEEVPEVVASKDVAEVPVTDKADATNEPREIDATQTAEEPQAI
ncbi:hypothetical protein GCG54_00000991 [Colletotrichum gloeosporioides]|uniref:Altered inheritance of mitochondria protein 21 n=1 Tax=Colletotrichum gloeosporioides TaxID=474922 RepID=A0A8H4FF86_COLGL|nr:uncharacterized protein GCG54_00000991 [Colletotrichum gloeosporioides]KAF3799745.1 hypothetical protein GCG54_00000991 [Colletotrichum gloeosporioides]